MPKFSLIPYPHDSHPAIDIICEFNQTDESVFISYKITGNLSLLDLGEGHPKHERKIKLWEKSCFELFIQNAQNEYIEFNFSPEFEWNSFYFKKKGDPIVEFLKMKTPKLDILLSLEVFHLIAEIDKKNFPEGFFLKDLGLKAGITSVIKDKEGKLSYWALSHEDQRPNFHHPDSFRYKF